MTLPEISLDIWTRVRINVIRLYFFNVQNVKYTVRLVNISIFNYFFDFSTGDVSIMLRSR